MSRRMLPVSLWLALTPAVSRAEFLVHPFSFSGAASSVNIDLPQFDPALGRFVEARLFVNGASTWIQFNVTNLGDKSLPLAIAALQNGGAGTAGRSLSVGFELVAGRRGPILESIAPRTTETITLGASTTAISPYMAVSTNPAEFVGTGTVNLGVAARSPELVIMAEWPGATFTIGPASWVVAGLGGRLIYEYTPFAPAVPEPSSVALMGMGLGGLALAAWRRRKAG